ncbi:LPS assembly lipoprotein LptE [Thalassococcus sp. BH17M4-6]|uniref:LPS assembly lipoprotein LptE n=1 Tax=Thalassococcus sp. BH17M4-6 TaxID=3413148 RepID=UPI003BDD420B
MSSSDRRLFLLGALALGACGFTPVYGPQGAGQRLQGRILLDAPVTENNYRLNRRIEERLGRGGAARYALSVDIDTESDGFGTASDGTTTRFRLTGTATYTLRDTATDVVLSERKTVAFTGYSATGSNVATLASARDARERLMVILADQIVDQLLLLSPDLPE